LEKALYPIIRSPFLMGKNDIQVTILFSGGLDSTACIYYYISQGLNVRAIFIDYGQKACRKEYYSAVKIASHFNIKLSLNTFKSENEFKSSEIKGRNAFLVLAALISDPLIKGIIALGIHSGTPYYDCTDLFVNDINRILQGYYDGKVILEAPFLHWNKRMIYNYSLDNNLPICLTYSCENGTDVPCGKCLSCLDRRALC